MEMEVSTRANLQIMKSKVMENMLQQMEKVIEANGKKERDMELESISMKRKKKEKDNGDKEKSSNGLNLKNLIEFSIQILISIVINNCEFYIC